MHVCTRCLKKIHRYKFNIKIALSLILKVFFSNKDKRRYCTSEHYNAYKVLNQLPFANHSWIKKMPKPSNQKTFPEHPACTHSLLKTTTKQ